MSSQDASGPLRSGKFVGRGDVIDLIRSALANPDRQTRIFYFVAPAGVGKTCLLQEAERLCKEEFAHSCQYGGFFDFNDTELHSNSRLEQRFLDYLDPQKVAFSAYRAKRSEFEEKRRVAPVWSQLDALRSQLGKLLAEGLNEFSANKKLVLCFDTLESLQYESDTIQNLIGEYIRREVIEARDWLAMHLPLVTNAVILLAGRSKPTLEDYLGSRFTSVNFERKELGDLSINEVQQYFASMAETYDKQGQPSIAKQMLEMQKDSARAHLLTEGRPLMLSFVTDLLRNGRPLPEEFQPVFKLPATTDEQKKIRERVKGKLANAVMNDSGISGVEIALPFIGLARKGVDTQLLELLMRDEEEGWDQPKCSQVLESLSNLSYAKPALKDGKLVKMYLHDELYDLLEENVIRKHIDEYAAKCAPIIGYYDQKIQDAVWASNRPEEFRLKAEQLYYRFVQNPRKGYEAYSQIFDRAIINRQIGLDMLVRDEMLRFFRPDISMNDNPNLRRAQEQDPALNAGRINRGAGIRWVQRLIAAGRFQEAIDAAEKLKGSNLRSEDDPLFVPILDTWEGEARVYLEGGAGEPLLSQAIKGFEEAESKITSDYQGILLSRNKGRAYNTRGYARVRQNHYAQAIRDYRIALPLLRENGQPHQITGTITNLAFAYLHTGQYLAAETLCLESYWLCEENNLGYLKGLTLNTLALVHLEADRPHRAAALSKQAIEIFEGLKEGGERRGIGLANLALGEARRRIAKLGIYLKDETEQFLDESEKALIAALDTFKPGGPSPEQPRQLEAYQELGCLYRQWARFLRGLGKAEPSRIDELENKAMAMYRSALPLATDEIVGARANLLNDIAELHYNKQRTDEAIAQLKESDDMIAKSDSNYLLTEGQGQPCEPMSSLYTILGKNSLLRGRIALMQKAYAEAAKQYTFASAYFDRSEGDQSAQEIAARRIFKIYHDLVNAGLRMDELREFKRQVEVIEDHWLYLRPGFNRPTTLLRNINDVLVIVSPIR